MVHNIIIMFLSSLVVVLPVLILAYLGFRGGVDRGGLVVTRYPPKIFEWSWQLLFALKV
jgi:hypothetical protein